MDVFESIADRRIQAGREAGLFDGLSGAGKPIPDIDQQREPGWWAMNLIKRERAQAESEGLDLSVPPSWRPTPR